MKRSTIALFLGAAPANAAFDDLAEAIGHIDGHLLIEHLACVSPVPRSFALGAPYGAIAIPDEWIGQRQETQSKLEAAREASRTWLEAQGISGEASFVLSETVTLAELAAERARLSDLSIVDNSLRETASCFEALVYDLLFRSCGPVMINAPRSSTVLAPAHVMVAWNASLPAARAVRLALPILRAARSVTVATVDADVDPHGDGEEPGADVARWLSHHGCAVTVQQYDGGGRPAGEVILSRAAESGADLVVMGGYAHTRLRQAVFGGTTRTLLAQTQMPLLLAH